jgi:hypothetical protein
MLQELCRFATGERLASQTFDDWQILLVDDGSTDNTAEVVAPFLDSLRLQRFSTSSRRTAVCRRQETPPFAPQPPNSSPCSMPTMCGFRAASQESVKVLRERPQAGLAYGGVTTIDQDGLPGDSFVGNRRFAEGRIAPQHLHANRSICPVPPLHSAGNASMRSASSTKRCAPPKTAISACASPCTTKLPLSPGSSRTTGCLPSSMTTDPERMLQAQTQFIEKHYGAPGCGRAARRIALSRCYKQRADALSVRRRSRGAALSSSLRALALYPLDIGNIRTAAIHAPARRWTQRGITGIETA